MRNNILFGVLLGFAITVSAQSPSGIWREFAPTDARENPLINAARFRSLHLSTEKMTAALAAAPKEFSGNPGTEILLPAPDGGWQRFSLFENALVPSELQQKYPQIRTYTAKGLDDPFAYARLDFTSEGFHAMVLSPGGDWFIDPWAPGNSNDYISYLRNDFSAPASKRQSEVMPAEWRTEKQLEQRDAHLKTTGSYSSGPVLRSYVAAISATGEYTDFHGGTIADGLSAITTTLNRVAGVYTVEFSVTFTLSPNNDTLIFADGATDPFTNSDVGFMIDENQPLIDDRIGNSNYDIGHIFGTEGGGLAYLGCVCTAGIKAGGATGLGSPVGDPFDVDYVAHEMGHQFDGNHTWNYCDGSGESGHRYEPGSASTIMGYAGLCGVDNLQTFSHPHFHTHNFDEIVAFTQFGSGSSCPTVTTTGNTPPTPVAEMDAFYIPKSTALKLTASATDTPGDTFTYSWEGFNTGPGGPIGSPSGTAAIFRSWLPSTSPVRFLPRLTEFVNNSAPWGELLPTYARALDFRVTVRDHEGGVTYTQYGFSVIGTAGPFLVTHPNIGGSTFAGGSLENITWDVANTDAAPVNCDTVNIMLSWDGGFTWPTTLAALTANDGSEIVTLPDSACTTCRIIIESHGNVFFDMSNYNFSIDTGLVALDPSHLEGAAIALYPQPASDEVVADVTQLHAGDVSFTIVNNLGQVLLTETVLKADKQFRVTWAVRDFSSGVYWVTVKTEAGSSVKKLVVLH